MAVLKVPSVQLSYDEAIRALNGLQTNALTLQKIRKERQKSAHLNLPVTRKHLERSGMTIENLNQLKIIHVSGTKGKGSTCAFCESILRHSGLKTGFFSSPHLVSVTERIKIDGIPIDQELFTSYFWEIYNKVCKEWPEDDRPPYFKFLTILAFNIFWRENVDVAIIEVGIGGEYDCTNIIERPIVTGITSLGLDHTSLLGNTIQDIAWHKAGIMKEGVVTFVDPHQKQEAVEVIWTRAKDIGSLPRMAPQLDQYKWPGGKMPTLGLYGEVQRHNASLALALTSYFLSVYNNGGDRDNSEVADMTRASPDAVKGLEKTVWPGRSQTLGKERAVFYLDGAHTEESVQSCVHWYSSVSDHDSDSDIARALVFNTTGDRDVRTLLQPLSQLSFDLVIFCSNIPHNCESVDQQNYNSNFQIQMNRCDLHKKVWSELSQDQSLIVPCFDDAIGWVTSNHCDIASGSKFKYPNSELPEKVAKSKSLEILVTGSLHLVGGVLGLIS